MERLLSEGSRQQRRLPIHPRWKQWGSRSRVPSPGGGVREEGRASTQLSYASALKLEEPTESFGVTGRGEEARGYVQVAKFPGIRLRWRRIACESGTAVFVFNLQTRRKRHLYAHTFACSEENTDLRFNTHSKDLHLYSFISVQTKPHVKKSGPNF